MAGRELAGPGWEGWRFHSGKLWTPEGHRIEPQDGSWWSLLVRQARGFRAAYAELHELRCELARAWKAGYLEPDWEAAAGRAAAPAALAPAPPGLVTSINNVNTGGQQAAEVISFSLQTDYKTISCHIPSDFPQLLTPKPAPFVSGPESASMPSSALPLTPTFEAVPGELAGVVKRSVPALPVLSLTALPEVRSSRIAAHLAGGNLSPSASARRSSGGSGLQARGNDLGAAV